MSRNISGSIEDLTVLTAAFDYWAPLKTGARVEGWDGYLHMYLLFNNDVCSVLDYYGNKTFTFYDYNFYGNFT